MAFPTITNSAVTAAATGTTNVTMTMPASIAAGRLLLSFIGGAAFTTMAASGWTSSFRFSSGGLSVTVLSKIAAGSDTMTLTRSISSTVTARTYQIDAWSGNLADLSAAGPSGTTVTDPPSLTPPGGAADYLWFAGLFTTTASSQVATAAPTNYTNLLTETNDSRALNHANRSLNAATEDPGTFTDAAPTTNNVAFTLAVAPVPPPSGGASLLQTPLIPRLRSFNW